MSDDPSETGVLVDTSVGEISGDLGIDYRSLFVDLGKATASGLVGFSTGNPAAFDKAIPAATRIPIVSLLTTKRIGSISGTSGGAGTGRHQARTMTTACRPVWRDRLGDITRQLLLNYALAYEDNETDFTEDASLNTLYDQLLDGVYR